MHHARQTEILHIGEGAGAFVGYVRARQRFAYQCVGHWIFEQRFRIELEIEAAGTDEIGKANSRIAVLGPDLAIGGDKVIGGHAEPLRGKRYQRFACGRGGAPDLHAAALNAVRSGRPPLVRCERGIAFDIFDLVDANPELLTGDLAHGDAKALPKVDLAAKVTVPSPSTARKESN